MHLTRLLIPLLILVSGPVLAQRPDTGGLDRPSSSSSPGLGSTDERDALQPLPPEEAFHLQADYRDETLLLHWRIEPGYYLYRKSFAVQGTNSGTTGDLRLPEGERVDDPFFGLVEIYRQNVTLTLPARPEDGRLSLEIAYQGCADARYCYPLLTRRIELRPARD